jgi:hypothetical protein
MVFDVDERRKASKHGGFADSCFHGLAATPNHHRRNTGGGLDVEKYRHMVEAWL